MFKCLITIFGFILLISIANCSKSKSSNCQYVSPPNSLFFLLKKAGNRLPDSILNNLKLSYNESGNKKFLSDFVRATAEGYNLGVMTTRLIGIRSADQNIKDFVIEYPNGTTDTIYADYEPPSTNNNCLYLIKQIKYNNQISYPDPNIPQQTVYLFNKP